MGASQTGQAELPSDTPAMGHFLKAEVALNQGDHDVATKEYELAVAADPTSALLRQRLAMLYVRDNRLPEALGQIAKGVEFDPSNVQARVLHAGILSALGRDGEAVTEYETVLELDPKNQEAHLFLGALYVVCVMCFPQGLVRLADRRRVPTT